MKVLVTGAGALIGQGIIRSLRRSQLKTHIVAVDPSPLAAGLYWSDSRHLVPMAVDPSYVERLSEIMHREKPDALLIGTDTELPILARNQQLLQDQHGTRVLVSPTNVVQIADDKHATYSFLREHGFDYPDTCLPEEVDDLVARVGFPLVVKPRHGARSVGVHVVNDERTLRARLVEGAGDDLVVQECVGTPEQEYTAGVLHFDGTTHATIVMRRDLRDGNTYRAFTDTYEDLNQQIRVIADALHPYGPANLQFRLARDRVHVFEINARFSGTTPLRALAGFNEVELCLRHLVLGEKIEPPTVAAMSILRHWSETLVPAGEELVP